MDNDKELPRNYTTPITVSEIPKELLDLIVEASQCRVKLISLVCQLKLYETDNTQSPRRKLLKAQHTALQAYRQSLQDRITFIATTQ